MRKICPSLLLLPFICFAEDARPAPTIEIAPSARIELENGWGAHFFGDLLYWKTGEEGLSYALSSLNFSANPPSPQDDVFHGVKGNVKRVDPEYAFGFRLGTWINLPWDGWDLAFYWTSYHNDQHSHLTANAPKAISPFWLNNNFNPMAQKAKASWKLTFDSLDLNLGRNFYAGDFLSLRPFVGLKAGWIHQRLNLKYEEITFSNGQTLPFLKSFNRDNSSGYGILGGLETKWRLGKGFSIEGNGSIALLWTDHEINQFEYNDPSIPRSQIRNPLSKIASMYDLFAGVRWEHVYCKQRLYVALHAGWEEQVWAAQNQLSRFIGNTENLGATMNNEGDLTFSGWTIGAALGF